MNTEEMALEITLKAMECDLIKRTPTQPDDAMTNNFGLAKDIAQFYKDLIFAFNE